MPIYEYACERCGSRLEVLQRVGDAPVTTCGSCSGPVQKLVSRSAFQLKGSGWYVTDYARKGSPAASPKSGAGESTSESKVETKVESKVETKADSKPDARPAPSEGGGK